MAKKTTKTAEAATGATGLRSLSQRDAAQLIGKHPSWLRDHPHIGGRNEDGTYDGPALVAAVRTDFKAIELPDADLEPTRLMCESCLGGIIYAGPALKLLERLLATHGAAGLAAFAIELIDVLRAEAMHESHYPSKSAEEILAQADLEIEENKKRDARSRGLVARKCARCGKYRWGRQWKAGALPAGYVADGDADFCPDCE